MSDRSKEEMSPAAYHFNIFSGAMKNFIFPRSVFIDLKKKKKKNIQYRYN